ncbi:hypothetical protein [Nonomuraea sp. NPDC050643]|uniref:hypothetical protein n=1 Tax=Nonomuraea sp. NPDC050643 TaxID=3155660 RepID=UPI0033CA8719
MLVADSVTSLGGEAAGEVVVTGSHGGLYPAELAAWLGVRAAIFHDAGVGLDGAGVAGLRYLEGEQIPAAAVGHDSACVGDGADVLSA